MFRKMFLTLGLVAAMIVIAVAGAEALNVSIGNGPGTAGNPIEVPITAGDTTGLGIIAGDIIFTYDTSKLTLTDVQSGTLTTNWAAEVNPGVAETSPGVPWHFPVYKDSAGTVKIAIYGKTVLAGSGSLANLIFQVKTGVSGSAALGLTSAKLYAKDASSPPTKKEAEQLVSVTPAGGSITIGGGLLGDVDNSGTVDVGDILAVVDHIYAVRDYGPAADVDNSGSVDVGDILAIVDIIYGK